MRSKRLFNRLNLATMFSAAIIGMSPGAGEAQTLTLNMAHIYNPGQVWYVAAEKYAKAIEARSNGSIKVHVSPSGSTGDWPQMIEALKIGTNDIVLEGISALDRYNPLAGIDSIPYLIRDADHFKAFYYGPVGQEYFDEVAKKTSFRVVGAGYRGARQLTSNKAVRSIDDLKGLKIRVPPSKISLRAWELLGASPTPMGVAELFTSLQQGVIDAQENPVDFIDGMKLYEVQKYLIETRHVIAAMTFIFSDRKLKSFPPEVQKILREEGARVMLETSQQIIDREEEYKKGLQAHGMEIIKPDLAPFRKRVAPLIKDFPNLEAWYAKIQAVK